MQTACNLFIRNLGWFLAINLMTPAMKLMELIPRAGAICRKILEI